MKTVNFNTADIKNSTEDELILYDKKCLTMLE